MHHRVSERRACKVLGQARSTQRRRAIIPDDEPVLVNEIIRLATQYGRYGYRTITDLLLAVLVTRTKLGRGKVLWAALMANIS